jgi:hypothetical protein
MRPLASAYALCGYIAGRRPFAASWLCDLSPLIRQYAVRENHMKAAQARLAGKRVDGKALSDRVRARLA